MSNNCSSMISVYMQNYLLQILLPQYGVVYLPQTIPVSPFVPDSSLVHSDRPMDCIRQPFGSAHGRAMEVVFSGGLAGILGAL